MGWWQIGRHGENFGIRATGMVWGDEPADIMDEALDRIRACFVRDWEREPTMSELRAGLKFSVSA